MTEAEPNLELIQDTSLTVRVANNQQIGCCGKVNLQFLVDNKQFKAEFLIIDTLLFHMILGCRFCKQNKLVLDMEDGSIYFKQFDLTTNPASEGSRYTTCCISSELEIPALSEKLVEVQVMRPLQGTHIIRRINTLALLELGISLGEGIVEMNGSKLKVALANLTQTDIRLKTETFVGVLIPFNADDWILSDEDSTALSTTALLSYLDSNDDGKAPETIDQLQEIIPDLTIDTSSLDATQIKRICSLLYAYRDIFGKTKPSVGNAAHVRHNIDTGEARPINCPPYRVGPKERETIDRLTNEMLAEGVISPSTSPWASPVVLVSKKDGSVRFCVDYRRLNHITVRDVYPLPRIDDCLSVLFGNSFFSTLDLIAGYWQVLMAEMDRLKTAFITNNGLFEFNVMPFGLTNAPATFQRYMDVVLAGLKWKSVLVYLDDIGIFSQTFEEHLGHLREVFERLRKYNLRLKPSKCNFFQREFKYLGHIISAEGIGCDPDKVKAILEMPAPKSVKQVRSFVGKCNYYREMLENYAIKCKPLYELLKLHNRFQWGEVEQQAFELLKKDLAKFPVVCHPNYDFPFKVQTDASDDGIGAVLTQFINGKERIIKCTSRVLQPFEKKWCPREKEALAVIYACESFRPFILHTFFTIQTDHESLQFLLKAKSPARLVRWSLKLSEFNFKIEYRRGSANANADALSRLPVDQMGENYEDFDREFGLNAIQTEGELEQLKLSQQQVTQAQRFDPDLRSLIDDCLDNANESSNKQFKIIDGLLYHIRNDGSQLLVIPRALVEHILSLYHNATLMIHPSRDRLYQLLRNRYFWNRMFADVRDWVNACTKCRQIKSTPPLTHGKLEPIITHQPFEKVGVDIVGPFTTSKEGYSYVLVCIDLYTSWVEAAPLKSITADEVCFEFFKIIVARHGCPITVISDHGKQFESKLFGQLCKSFNINHVMASAYHHQTNGKVEKFLKFLENSLAMVASADLSNWCRMLDKALFTYRVSLNRMLNETPFYLLYGRDAILPNDLLVFRKQQLGHRAIVSEDLEQYKLEVVKRLSEAYEQLNKHKEAVQTKYKEYYDQSQKDVEYQVGDKVFVYKPASKEGLSFKLLPHWTGPYEISAKVDRLTYRVKIIKRTRLKDQIRYEPVHVQRLRLYKPWTRTSN